MPEPITATLKDGRTFPAEIVTLSDGRQVMVRELDGLEGPIARGIATRDKYPDPGAIGEVIVCLAIHEIDGKPFPRVSNLSDVRVFLKSIRMRDSARLQAAISRLNGGEEDETTGEVEAADEQ